MKDLDVIGYTRSGLEFCLRCAPAVDRREAFELHRFEAEGDCCQCGAYLPLASDVLSAYR